MLLGEGCASIPGTGSFVMFLYSFCNLFKHPLSAIVHEARLSTRFGSSRSRCNTRLFHADLQRLFSQPSVSVEGVFSSRNLHNRAFLTDRRRTEPRHRPWSNCRCGCVLSSHRDRSNRVSRGFSTWTSFLLSFQIFQWIGFKPGWRLARTEGIGSTSGRGCDGHAHVHLSG